MSWSGPPGSVRLPRSKTTLAKQHGRSEPLVRIPAWISSGCWPQQQEGTLQHGGKTRDVLSEQQPSGQRYSHAVVMMEYYLAFGQFEPAVCVYEAEVTCKEPRGALCVA